MKKTNTTNTTANTTNATAERLTLAAVEERLTAINEQTATATADAIAAALESVKADLQTLSNENRADRTQELCGIAVNDTAAFWRAFLESGVYTAYTVREKKGEGYYIAEITKPLSFLAIDRAYKEVTEQDENAKHTIAENPHFFRTLSHLTHNIITASASNINAAHTLKLNENSRTTIAGVDFAKNSIGAMEQQVNALIACLMPADIIGTTALRRADVRHLTDFCDSALKLDYKSEKRDGHIKAKNEAAMLNEILAIFIMRQHGGDYKMDSRAKAHRAEKKSK